MTTPLILRRFAQVDYLPCWQAMRDLTAKRTASTADELWLLEHPPVFTLGHAGKPEHVLMPGDIPVIHCDRGGQVTYHGPGQLVGYLMLDINRLGMGSRVLVHTIEQAIVTLLETIGLSTHNDPDAPGIYVANRKIASLGLRIKQGRTYHGLSLNNTMSLSDWQRINPCGHAGQAVTSLANEGISLAREPLETRLAQHLAHALSAVSNTPLTLEEHGTPDWYNPHSDTHNGKAHHSFSEA